VVEKSEQLGKDKHQALDRDLGLQLAVICANLVEEALELGVVVEKGLGLRAQVEQVSSPRGGGRGQVVSGDDLVDKGQKRVRGRGYLERGEVGSGSYGLPRSSVAVYPQEDER